MVTTASDNTQGAEPGAARGREKHRGWLVIGVLLLVATVVGVLSYWRFIVSDRHLRADIARMERRGASIGVEQCIDEVVRWAGRCKAMKSLCDAEAPRLADVCLAARDRSAYCAQLGDRHRETSFGFKECQARKVTRKTKKACATAYRAIANHCDHLNKTAAAK